MASEPLNLRELLDDIDDDDCISQSESDALQHELSLLEAKAAVCDAARAMHGNPSNHALGDAYRDAVDIVRELEAKKP